MSLEDLYQDIIVDHHKRPRSRGTLETPDAESKLFNPLCGDEVQIQLCAKDGVVSEIVFDGKGCSISQASASMMTEICKGKSIEEVQKLIDVFTRMMKGEAAEEELESLGDAEALQGVRKFAARIKCAMLGWEACDQCIKKL